MKHINVSLFVPDEGCPHRCSFCNQKTISGKTEPPTVFDVHKAVETALCSRYDTSGGEIAFFGGSFTAIERTYMEALLSAAYEYVEKGLFKGIRISTRPDCIDKEILSVLKRYGVTSIELGCQSTDDEVLAMNERGHTKKDIEKACQLIKESGFELGVQMMTGLFGDSEEKCLKTAETLISLRPDTARIYPTIVLQGTALEKLYKAGIYKAQTLEEAIELCSKLLLLFDKAGIPVIRLGLHSGGNVSERYVAGAFHPAFREKCESRIYFNKMLSLCKKQGISGGRVIFTVSSRCISQAVGQNKENVKKLCDLGFEPVFEQSEELQKYEIKVN